MTTVTATAEAPAATPYELIGGAETVQRFVNAFYDLMRDDPQYKALRDLHAEDLTPMRASLAGFLNGWLGGPRDWFAEHPGVCMMSAHARIPVTFETARQWAHAMARAMDACDVPPDLARQVNAAFERMSQGMAAR